jgi:hypothetical protein
MRSAIVIICAMALGACSGGDGDDARDFDNSLDSQDGDGGKDDSSLGETVPLVLEHAAVAGTADRPNVVVYVPTGYDASHPNVVVFLHGWNNCVSNVIRKRNSPCTNGGPARNAYDLAGQLERANKNALLVVPELAFDRESSEPFGFAEAGRFGEMLDETLAQLGSAAPEHLVVASHSGGYRAAAAIASVGGRTVDEVWLLDSLYGELDAFDAYASGTGRFASIYSLGGGTLANNQAMATRARDWVATAELLDDRTTRTLADADFAARLLYKRSALAHDDIPRYYTGRLLATSSLPAKP